MILNKNCRIAGIPGIEARNIVRTLQQNDTRATVVERLKERHNMGFHVASIWLTNLVQHGYVKESHDGDIERTDMGRQLCVARTDNPTKARERMASNSIIEHLVCIQIEDSPA
jgi:hypothetical protein